MSLIIVLVRIALTVIFALAGITKLQDQPGTREAVGNFGAPKALVPAIAMVLPFIELAVAAGFLFSQTVSLSAITAMALLGVFVVAISVNLARGQKHDCHCFGQLYSRPLGWPTLARNVVFALGAGFVWWQATLAPSPNIFTTFNNLSLAEWGVVAAVAIVVVALLLYVRNRQRALLAARVPDEGLPIDAVAPHFELPSYEGGTKSLAQLLDYGKPLLLLFTNPFCGPCIALFEEIKEWQHAHRDRLTIALITRGTIKDNFVNVARNSLGEVLLQREREVGEMYGGRATPTGVVINPNGRIASKVAAGAEEIRMLLQNVVESNGTGQ